MNQQKRPKYMTDSLGRNTMRWTNPTTGDVKSLSRIPAPTDKNPASSVNGGVKLKRADLARFIPRDAPMIQDRLRKETEFAQQLVNSYTDYDGGDLEGLAQAKERLSTTYERTLDTMVNDVNDIVNQIIEPEQAPPNKNEEVTLAFMIENQDRVFGGADPIYDAVEEFLADS